MLTAIKGKIDSNTIIVGDFNMPLISMDRSYRQKISKETQALNDTLNQMDLIDIYRPFHPKTTKYTFFSSSYGTFPELIKANFSKFKKIKIISSIFSDHNTAILEINNKDKTVKIQTWGSYTVCYSPTNGTLKK